MSRLEPLLTVAPGLLGAARADESGNVLETAGQLDGESICAVAAMCRAPLERVSSFLDLGHLQDWSFSYATGSLYVHEGEGMVVVTGAPTKNPETVMKKLTLALGERGS